MSAGRDDLFELLLPEEPPDERGRARRVSTFLRLLLGDAGGAPAEVVGGALCEARAALDDVTRAELATALEALLGHYLAALRRPESYVEVPLAAHDLEAAWSLVLDCRGGAPAAVAGEIPGLPVPGEPVAVTVRRLLVAQVRWGGATTAWELRLRHLLEGPRAAEEAAADARAALAGDAPVALRAELEAELALARLARGRPREAARALLEDGLELVGRSPRLARLATWGLAMDGRLDEARALAPGFAERTTRLPSALAELVARRPEFADVLVGRPDPGQDASAVEHVWRPSATRLGLGALAVLRVRLGPAWTPRVLGADVAPALRDGVGAWARSRDGAARRIGEPEQRLLSTASAVVQLRTGREPPLRGALDPERARAVALVPSPGPDGEVTGWLHVECDHLAVPSEVQLVAAAAALVRTPAARGVTAGPAPVARVGEAALPFDAAGRPRGDGQTLAQTAGAAVSAFRLGLARRAWAWYDVAHAPDGQRLVAVATGGSEPALLQELPSRATLRALRTGVPVVREQPDGGPARSELALPLVTGGRVTGVFALASTRARDVGERDARRLGARLDDWSEAWRAARFRTWHRRHRGEDVHVDLAARAWAPLARDAASLARLRRPLALVGPEGAGKDVALAWLLHERDEGAPRVLRCGADGELVGPPPGDWSRASVVLDGLERLDAPAAERAARTLELASRGGALVVAQLRAWPRAEVGPLARLAARLRRAAIAVPPLADRRDELPGLVDALIGAVALEEGLALPRLGDAALAILWRLAWPDNVRGLEAVVTRLVAAFPGRVVGVEPLRRLLLELGHEPRERLPSRHPRRRDVEDALAVTRKKSGAWNKTRAALYLGWDPDTLARRLRELGLREPAAGGSR